MCDICGYKGETKHYSFYVFGSEGVNLCESCQIAASNYLRNIRDACNRAKNQTYKNIATIRMGGEP
jgi:hypothetical protein